MANKTGIDLFTALLVLIEHLLSALLPFSLGLLLLAKRLTDQIYSVQKSHAAQKYGFSHRNPAHGHTALARPCALHEGVNSFRSDWFHVANARANTVYR